MVALLEVNREDISSHFSIGDVDKQLADCFGNCNEGYESEEFNAQKLLVVETYFKNVLSFKHAIQFEAIINNFEMRIRTNNKKCVIATCSYRWCKWRIQTSLYEDAQTFQMRRVDVIHTNPIINIVGNRKAILS